MDIAIYHERALVTDALTAAGAAPPQAHAAPPFTSRQGVDNTAQPPPKKTSASTGGTNGGWSPEVQETHVSSRCDIDQRSELTAEEVGAWCMPTNTNTISNDYLLHGSLRL
jgi:hypothetical protein